MRLKWFKLAAAVVMLGTSAQAEWKFQDFYGRIEATSKSVAEWREIMASALWLNSETRGGIAFWDILYLHPDGSIWDCKLNRNVPETMSCTVLR
jgi:hypothetical protein